MKKVLVLLLSAGIFTFVACGGSEHKAEEMTDSTAVNAELDSLMSEADTMSVDSMMMDSVVAE
jgi:hypothetical protein